MRKFIKFLVAWVLVVLASAALILGSGYLIANHLTALIVAAIAFFTGSIAWDLVEKWDCRK